jgi:hypothetical protein
MLHCKRKIFFSYVRIIVLGCAFSFMINSIAFAQSKKSSNKPAKLNTKEFVISYAIVISGNKTDGIQQTYNGGTKTAFVKNDLVRLRLVSLMRVQSLYFNNKKGLKTKVATIVKESGKDKSAMILNAKEWKLYNKRNDSIRCEIFKDDTLRILDQLCNKAILTFKDSSKLAVYYLPNSKNKTLASAEPIFASVPGLVMKYSFEKDSKTLDYTATQLRFATVATNIFNKVPSDYLQVKYNPNGTTSAVTADAEEDDNGTEEEETEMETTPPPTNPSTTQPSKPVENKEPVIAPKPPF